MIATDTKKDLEDGIYLEEGSDLIDFECNINKALTEICESREVKHIQFKTGLQEMPNNLKKSWYSMAIHHQPKMSIGLGDVLVKFDKLEESCKESCEEFKVYLEKVKKAKKKKNLKAAEAKKVKEANKARLARVARALMLSKAKEKAKSEVKE